MDIAWGEGDIARSEYARPSLTIVLSSRNAIANEDINGVTRILMELLERYNRGDFCPTIIRCNNVKFQLSLNESSHLTHIYIYFLQNYKIFISRLPKLYFEKLRESNFFYLFF